MRPACKLLLFLLLSVSASLLPLASCHGHRRSHRPSPPLRPHPTPAPPASPVPAAVHDICSRTDYPDICISAVEPYLPDHPKIDAPAMLNMSIQAAKARTQAAIASAKKHTADPLPFELVNRFLNNCIECYANAVEQFDKAAQAAAVGEVAAVNSTLREAIADFKDCGYGFGEIYLMNPMTKEDEYLTKMSGNCLAITAQL